MRTPILGLLAIAAVSLADRWAGMENLPDGTYSGINHPNGSTTMTCLDSGAKYTFDLVKDSAGPMKPSDHAIAKRDTSCWGYELDHGGVDEGVVALKAWAGDSGHDLKAPNDRTDYWGSNRRGVYVYYCINKPGSQGNLDINDVNYALRNMDSTCHAYIAGYFQWPGSAELVGKCRSGTPVCLG